VNEPPINVSAVAPTKIAFNIKNLQWRFDTVKVETDHAQMVSRKLNFGHLGHSV
jgi:hypothetical protein